MQCITVLIHNQIFARSLDLLASQQSRRIVFNTLEGSYALCLVANLVQLGHILRTSVFPKVANPTFLVCIFTFQV